MVKHVKNKAETKNFNNGENILFKTNYKKLMMRYRREINRKKFVIFE